METTLNNPDAADPATAFLFHAGRDWREAANPELWTRSVP